MASEHRTSAPVDLPVHLIRFEGRQRPIDQGKVANLRVSMGENGFFGAILVRPPLEGSDGHYRGVIGAHRFTAWRAEGHATIPGHVRILTDDEALQIEIDENLVREDLTPLERAEAVEARFAVWMRRFPDRIIEEAGAAAPKRGRPANSVNMTELTGGAPTMGFHADTAALVGLSKSTIERAFRVVAGIPADIRRQLHGTPISRNDGALRQLAALGDRKEQAAVAAVLISGKTKSVTEAQVYAAGGQPSKATKAPVDETVKAFRKLWGSASPSARAAILHDLTGRKLPEGYDLTAPAHD